MDITQLKNENIVLPIEFISFINELDKFSSKKEIAYALINILLPKFSAKFSSYVEKKEDSLSVVCQIGESNSVKNVFNKEMCEQIYNWVMSQRQLASLKIPGKENFIFVPLIDQSTSQSIEHGLLVFCIADDLIGINKELNVAVNLLSKVTSLFMTRFFRNDNEASFLRLQEDISSELKLTAKLQKSISGSESNEKILFSVLEDGSSCFNGNFWWISDLNPDITLVLIGQVVGGLPSSMVSGYVLGEMNGLKTRAEISLKPKEVLSHLNKQLNNIFKSTGISVNAWYGVFNVGARNVRFSNANHPDPFLIGPEQQVSNLIIHPGEKGNSLGISMSSNYEETSSFISGGSKLIICTKDLLEQASKIGSKYDPTWLPSVLETLGGLSLVELKRGLENILSEKHLPGTAQKLSRLALLLEVSS